MVKKSTKRNILISVVVIVLVILSFFIFSTGVLQSITAVSTYEDNQGELHWLISGVADDVDEGYTFRSLPSSKTLSDGTKITPRETATLTISKKESFCEYQLRRVDKSRLLGTLKITYYELLASERVALIDVKDDSGNTRTIDGTITQTETFYDNGGELKFKSLGIIGSKKDCESGSNVAIVFANGETNVWEKADLDSEFSRATIFSPFKITNVDKNTNFLSNFNDYSATTSNFKGDVDIGSVQFTIDADQRYYDSFIFTPAKAVDPKVSLSVPSGENADGTYSVKAIITNNADSSGNAVIKATVSQGSITPSSQNIILDREKTLNFIVKAPNQNAEQEICVEAKSVDGSNSHKDCKTTTISLEEVESSCGNTNCDDWESFTSCPTDCVKEEGDTDSEGECKWYQEEFTSIEKDYGAYYWRAYTPFADPITTETRGCKNAGWLNAFLIIGTLVLLLTIFSWMFKPQIKKFIDARS